MTIWRFSKTQIGDEDNHTEWEEFYNKKPTKEILKKSLKDKDDLKGVDIEQILEKGYYKYEGYYTLVYDLEEINVIEI